MGYRDVQYIMQNSQVPDDRPLVVNIRDWAGINTFNHETEIQDNQATVAYNANLSTIGKAKKRLGSVQVLNDPGGNAVVGLHYFNAPNVDERMIHIQGKRVYDSTSPLATTGSWVDVEGSDGFTEDIRSTSMILADDRTYITNGEDPVHYHNGAGIIEEGDESNDPPFCKVGCYFKNRLWLANEKSRATIIGDADSFTGEAGDYLKVTLTGYDAYDDIDLSSATSISDVVTAINTATNGTEIFNTVGLAWEDTGGYLRISHLITGADKSVTIEDGSSDNKEATEALFNGTTVTDSGDENPEYVYYSNALVTETFDRNTQIFKVESGEATEITAMVAGGRNAPDSLLIFKEGSIHELAIQGGTATYWTLRPLDKSSGCASYNCAVSHSGIVYYMSHTGIKTIGGKHDQLPMTKWIQTTWNTLNRDYIKRSRMILFDEKLFLAIPTTQNYNDKVLVWDLLTERWSIWTGLNVGCWGIYTEQTAEDDNAYQDTLMYGDSNDGKVYHLLKSGIYQDAGTDINFQWETKAFDFKDPELYKAGGELILRVETSPGVGNITVYAAIDGGAYSSLGTCTATETFHLDSLGEFQNIKFKIIHTGTNTVQLSLNGYTLRTYMSGYQGE